MAFWNLKKKTNRNECWTELGQQQRRILKKIESRKEDWKKGVNGRERWWERKGKREGEMEILGDEKMPADIIYLFIYPTREMRPTHLWTLHILKRLLYFSGNGMLGDHLKSGFQRDVAERGVTGHSHGYIISVVGNLIHPTKDWPRYYRELGDL